MKKALVLIIPIVMITLFAIFSSRLMASGAVNPSTLIFIAVAAFLLMILFRPKKQPTGGNQGSALSLLGDFSKDAFSYDASLSSLFQAAISDYLKSMPKSAQRKLEKLQPLCKTDADTYAVCVALGMIKCHDQEYDAAVKLYNKAVVLHPTAALAEAIGSAQQRMGELEKAIDSYEFALELDPSCLDIRAKLATAYVANGGFETAIEHAQLVLDLNSAHPSALATIAICHGVLGRASLYESYTARAVEAGYSEQKITSTVPALKKKFKR